MHTENLFSKQYPELDLIRTLAITMILMQHYYDVILKGTFGLLPGFLPNILAKGWHGVDLFFALSGFLIGGQIIEGCYNGTFRFNVFFLKRFFRIVPAYIFAIVVFIIFYSYVSDSFLLNDPTVLKDVIIHILYLQDYIHTEYVMYDGIYWSLAVEEKFYLVLPLIIFLVLKYRRKTSLIFVLLALLITGISIRLITFDSTKDFWSSYLVPFHNRFDNLLFGVLAAFLFIYLKGIFSKKLKYAVMLISILSLGFVFAFGNTASNYFSVGWQFTFSGLGFAALILAFIAFNIGDIPYLKSIASSVARYSYTMYLYHYLVLGITQAFLKGYLKQWGVSPVSVMAVFGIFFMVVYSSSVVLYYLIEWPFMNIRKRILKKKTLIPNASLAV